MVNIYTHRNEHIFELTCHTQLGDINDKDGRFYLPGKVYKAKLEPIVTSNNTNNQPCTLVWVEMSDKFDKFGSRFAIVGNIYQQGKPYWDAFTKYFECPSIEKRDEKITQIISI